MKQPHLNRKLVLESPARVSDGAGGFDEGWVPQGVLWAQVDARSGREQAQPGVLLSSVGYRITVRATPVGSAQRPAPEDRFREGVRVFAITAVREAGPRYLICDATEEAAA